ncbi:MAG TPA: PIG-L family deacetylase [Planctomycetota bacterium]|nr:PIG-L family deacetylase [Planctomycetota bacterium]
MSRQVPAAERAFLSAARLAALAVAAFLALIAPASAQRPPEQLDGAAILHRLHSLETVGSALYIAAHPDDENTRLITWLGNGRKVRTAYLSLTRGDGGQNLIGRELGDGLGIIRTEELREARRIDGGEQFFTRAVDFGYSKTPEESFAKWGRHEVLGDVVRVIRTFRPDVIITRFAPEGSGTHGHHTASALLAQEAFDLAADPAAFPEQLADGLQPWQPKRLFFNASTWWRADLAEQARKDPAHWLAVDVGAFDPLLGASYTELAGRSRSQHKSQGFGAAETRGEQLEYLRLDKGAPFANPDLFDGIDLGWSRVQDGARVQALLADVIGSYDIEAPERNLPGLAGVVRALDELAASPAAGSGWARFHARAARELLLQLCGVVVQVTSDESTIAAGDTLPVTVSALQRSAGPALEFLGVTAPDGATTAVAQALPRNRAVETTLAWTVPASQPGDQPYWLTAPHGTLYQPDRARLTHRAATGSAPSNIAPVNIEPVGIEPVAPGAASFRVELRLPDGSSLQVDRQAMHTWVDRVAGERTRPVAVTAVASLTVADAVVLVRGERASVTVDVEALTNDLGGELSAALPHGWTIEHAPPPVQGLARGERVTLHLDLRRAPDAARGVMHLSFAGPKGATDRTLHVIDHPHILPQTWSTPADVLLLPEDIAVTARRVGYIEGAGDEVPAALERLGVVVERIDPATAHASDLERCDAVVTGIRAYDTVPALARFQPTLLRYVEDGGTLLVQYDTNGSDLVLPANRIGPHPFELTRDRVTLEDAAPTFLAPSHPLMLFPNALGAGDFEGWVQERGLYFAGSLDPAYVPLIAWNDPGEAPLNGALVACDFGKGRFIYTGLSLFRQLPAGVAGSYRILANLIARRAAGT